MKKTEYIRQLVQMLGRTQKRKHKYEKVFNTPTGTEVLADLAVFCQMDTSTFDTDPLEMARKNGQREVFLYISSILKKNLTDLERQIKEARENVNRS